MLLPISVASADAPGVSVKQGAGYTATKISHPSNGLGQDDGIVNVDKNGDSTVADGNADRGQSYAWSSLGYGDWMYVGTCYSAMGSTLKHIAHNLGTSYAKLKAGIDVLFNGELYLDNGENHSLLLKINTKTGETKIVVPPIQIATGGKMNVNGYRAAVEFHDKLYFAAAAQGTPYLLEVDPKDDSSKIVYQSGGVAPGISTGIRGLAVMNNELIASMIGAQGAYIVASSDPSAGADSFRTIATQQDLLNYPAYHYTDNIFGGAIWDMVTFNNRLYITVVTGTANNKQSFALFRGEEGADGKWTYTPLVGDPADGARYEYGFGATRSGAANMVVTSDGLNFQTVTRNGFGDNNNHGLRVFAVTNSGLAVGTANPYHGAQVWLLNDGTEVKNASLTAGKAFAYDKYDSAAAAPNAAGLNVGINFNGNTVEGVEYDYKALTAGADYVVNEDGSGITLTSAFLNAQETGSTGSVVVRFNRGARVDFTVDVKDSTPDKPNPDNPVTPTQPSKPTTPTVQQGANAPADVISNTGSNVMGMIVAAAVLVLAGGAMLLLRRQRNK